MKPVINIYVLSDNHFNHWNINRLCERGFNSLEHMNNTMISRWNRAVKPNDLVIHLGDLIFTKGASEEVAKVIKCLNGRKVLIKGNHDRKSYSWYLTHGINFICEKSVWYYNKKSILFVHRPSDVSLAEIKRYDYIIHGHQHNSTPLIQQKGETVFVNISVENVKYSPVNLITLLNRLKQAYYKERG